jgi:hypothetical protein
MKPLELHSQNLQSITSAIQTAGGSVNALLTKDVLSFLETLAQNGVSLTAEFQSQSGMKVVDGWVINTKTTYGHPTTLSEEDVIDVILSNGLTHTSSPAAWDQSWDINNDFRHIVKYRKVK